MPDVDEILALYNSGMKQIDIAAKLGISRPHISNLLRRQPGYQGRKKTSILDPEVVMRLYKSGLSQSMIGKMFGLTQTAVGHKLRQHPDWTAVSRDNANKWPPERIAEVLRLHSEGRNLAQIAREVGSKSSQVKRHLLAAGEQPRSQSEAQSGENNWAWTGGRIRDNKYWLVYSPQHPYATKHGYVREHRLVMEAMVGRYLEPGEVVHHKDGNPENNHPDNLQLFASNAEHLAVDLAGKCPKWSEDGKRRIAEAARKRKLA